MGKDWDKAVPSVTIWKECLRVLKPGAFMFVMSSPRQDVLSQMIVRLDDAGFETGFTSIYHTFASGFPKSENISLHIDKQECKKELIEKLERKPTKEEFEKEWKNFRKKLGRNPNSRENCDKTNTLYESGTVGKTDYITEPKSEQAKELSGSFGGYQPKPAVEVILVCMKPLSKKTYVDQALKNSKGITWLHDCRIPYESKDKPQGGYGRMDIGIGKPLEHQKYTKRKPRQGGTVFKQSGFKAENNDIASASPLGRFPSNLLVSDNILDDMKNHKSGKMAQHIKGKKYNCYGQMYDRYVETIGDDGGYSRFFSLDKWAEKTFPFLIVPKASRSEKNKGLSKSENIRKCRWNNAGKWENLETKSYGNNHPSVKSIKLFSYLVTLASRKNDTVLDPFMGTGTTGIACNLLGRKFIGIEISEEYIDIARRRLSAETQQAKFDL